MILTTYICQAGLQSLWFSNSKLSMICVLFLSYWCLAEEDFFQMTRLLKQLLHSNNPYICQVIIAAQRLKT
jgi:hypothetical protein